MTNYARVIPRDLFNESKLLKCLGQLCLLIHDNGAGRLKFYHDDIKRKRFQIGVRQSDGGHYCKNLHFTIDGKRVEVYGIMNSREPYPLLFTADDGDEYEVFHSDGSLSDDFRQLVLGEVDGSRED